jgi:hypothetical protein
MPLPVIALRSPPADDLLQLIQEVERLLLGILAAPVYVRPLVAGQRGQQLLAEVRKNRSRAALSVAR